MALCQKHPGHHRLVVTRHVNCSTGWYRLNMSIGSTGAVLMLNQNENLRQYLLLLWAKIVYFYIDEHRKLIIHGTFLFFFKKYTLNLHYKL